MGATDGAFVIFTPPCEALPLLVEFLDQLAARGIIFDYHIFVNDETRREFLKADLRIFNTSSGSWEFEWNKWLERDEPLTVTNGGQVQVLMVEPELHKLNKNDIKLLRIITDDAKLPTEEMAKATNMEPHVLRRRIQTLEDNGFIVGYRAMLKYSKFHLTSSMLFNCNARPNEVEMCRRKLLSLPFPGTFIPVQNGFLCQATLPPEGLPPVHRFLAQHCNNVEVSWFDLPTSDVASLNSDAYDDGDWRKDPTFFIDEPLQQIGKKKPNQ